MILTPSAEIVDVLDPPFLLTVVAQLRVHRVGPEFAAMVVTPASALASRLAADRLLGPVW
jgi:hypothetical protein